MTRQLRPRKAAKAHDVAADDVPGPSTIVLSDADSGSDFSPDKDAEGIPDDDFLDEESMEQDAVAEDEPMEIISDVKGKGKAKAKKAPKKSTSAITPGGRRKSQVLPAPSLHHRHRATPLFSIEGQVER